MVYDQILTFSEETQKIWSRRITLPSAVFLLNRYISFVGYIVVAYFFVLLRPNIVRDELLDKNSL